MIQTMGFRSLETNITQHSNKLSMTKKKILYVQTSGTDTPERLYAPFILGSTAVAMGIEATIYFVIKGITVVKSGEAEKIKIGGFPSLKEVMDQAVNAGVKLMVCEQSCHYLTSRGEALLAKRI